jgi:hypothetical protein
MRFSALVLLILLMAGCSTSAPTMRNVSVDYRFENVKVAPAPSEWTRVESVLKRYVKTVDAEVVRERTAGDTTVRTYRTRLVLPDLEALAAIHADLEALRLSPRPGERIDYRFDGLSAAYRSSFVTAGVSTLVSGFTVEGNIVKLYTQPRGEAIPTSKVRSGMWSAKLEGVPADKWVYGVSEDPKGSLPRRYFRVNAATLQIETLEESEFAAWYGRPVGESEANNRE